ncbi:junctional adhesion molecule C-like [Diabrotica virgifera virgifera]|uniref:Junctional adhesion molecule C-like n=1 Tax=Diabrotica virgifera virgifera TaxID=50390 RepID=A0A6P7FGC4_DIAVI|nr:junctional adhesion molecule C-like [Diabrotica virgifera virgifera]
MLKISLIIFVCVLLRKCIGSVNRSEYFFQEVPVGETAVLKCKSSDHDYNFDSWILDNNVIIDNSSIANPRFDNKTFSLEPVTGNLTIRTISKEQEGLYACISRNAATGERRVERIKVIVDQDWEDVYEHDSNINLIRVLIIVATLVLVAIGGYVIFRMWRERYYYPSYLGHEDESESIEEIYRSPTTSGLNRSRSPRRIILERTISHPIDGDSVSTDFKSILERTNS